MKENSRYWRQLDIVDPQKLAETPVTLIGAGGIGSAVALALAKLGVTRFTVYDDDSIEEHNFPNQMYPYIQYMDAGCEHEGHYVPESTPGKPKAITLAAALEDIVGWGSVKVRVRNERFEHQPVAGLVISGVDSLETRQALWGHLRDNFQVPLYLDARMGAEIAQVYAVRPLHEQDRERYERSLEGEGYEVPCTARATIYGAFAVAALVCRLVKGYVMGQDLPFEVILDMKSLTLLKRG